MSVASVRCKCGFKWCFRCKEEAHDPCTCALLARWLDKCRNESETAHWIMANTRQCPKSVHTRPLAAHLSPLSDRLVSPALCLSVCSHSLCQVYGPYREESGL